MESKLQWFEQKKWKWQLINHQKLNKWPPFLIITKILRMCFLPISIQQLQLPTTLSVCCMVNLDTIKCENRCPSLCEPKKPFKSITGFLGFNTLLKSKAIKFLRDYQIWFVSSHLFDRNLSPTNFDLKRTDRDILTTFTLVSIP